MYIRCSFVTLSQSEEIADCHGNIVWQTCDYLYLVSNVNMPIKFKQTNVEAKTPLVVDCSGFSDLVDIAILVRKKQNNTIRYHG